MVERVDVHSIRLVWCEGGLHSGSGDWCWVLGVAAADVKVLLVHR
jgi:hypothetical protein